MSATRKEGKETKDKEGGEVFSSAAAAAQVQALMRDQSRDEALSRHFIFTDLRPDMDALALQR